ncbi:hypothetical protein BE18_22800 [Sorangium cellulosum]|uniref:Uncharacterized protein n=1 Tax=Sorangium cellulosum TaxID=56 RepID=A0A150S9Y4_SORCE|nr:hypothetical protein BE18_22800 [Sorangium cellulosum]
MSVFVVFDSESAAVSFIAQVDALLGYPITGTVNGQVIVLTRTWAEPMKHPDRDEWAVPYAPEIAPALGDHVPVELDESWWPPVWIPPG